MTDKLHDTTQPPNVRVIGRIRIGCSLQNSGLSSTQRRSLRMGRTRELDLWLRPALAPRDRSLVTTSALIASGQVAQITYHLGRAMDNGLTASEAGEIVTHIAFYAGWPNASQQRQSSKMFSKNARTEEFPIKTWNENEIAISRPRTTCMFRRSGTTGRRTELRHGSGPWLWMEIFTSVPTAVSRPVGTKRPCSNRQGESPLPVWPKRLLLWMLRRAHKQISTLLTARSTATARTSLP